MDPHPVSFYVHELRRRLPAETFQPTPTRLAWLPCHLAIIAIGIYAIAGRWLPWPVVPLLSIVIGMSFAGLLFLGHETLHGAIVRGRWRWVQPIVGWICFAPFAVSPQLWVVWHNRVHHAHTNEFDVDPDMYPSLARYLADPRTRWVTDSFALGGRRKRGVLSTLFGFLVQSKNVLRVGRSQLGMTKREHRLALVETMLAVALWVAVGVLIGLVPFWFGFVIPLVVADVIVMGFILTNHGLSAATDINDPFINSLSVTGPRWLEWLTLEFGYHVEHHLFPSMSGCHMRRVCEEIHVLWPERYETMRVWSALRALYRTGRVYKDATTLVDPRTGEEWQTLGAREAQVYGVPAYAGR